MELLPDIDQVTRAIIDSGVRFRLEMNRDGSWTAAVDFGKALSCVDGKTLEVSEVQTCPTAEEACRRLAYYFLRLPRPADG